MGGPLGPPRKPCSLELHENSFCLTAKKSPNISFLSGGAAPAVGAGLATAAIVTATADA